MPDLSVKNKKHQLNLTNLSYPDAPAPTPFKDDQLAEKFAPRIIAGSEHGDPTRLFYRANKDTEGNTLIAYHFIWGSQRNNSPGFMPFLGRQIYSNAHRLHGLVFGKSDVEMVFVKINPKGELESMAYSTADSYNPRALKVKHKFVEQSSFPEGAMPLEIATWNHLLKVSSDRISDEAKLVSLQAEYFTEKLWTEYRMIKSKTWLFRRDRDHLSFEINAVPDKN